MPIKPEEITAENLPQGVRGYQKEATENLLKLVAWDYRRVLREQSLDEEELQRLRNKVDQLETELQALRSLLDAQPHAEPQHDERRHAELEAEVERLQSALAAQRRREDLPEALLSSALRSARELRNEARVECEQILKAARRRAEQIEQEARRSVHRSAGEVERLHRMESDLRDQLRRMLQTLIEGGNGSGNGHPTSELPDTVVELPTALPAAD